VTSTAPAFQPWPVIITEWALDAYLNLKYNHVFSDLDYRTTIRPDVVLLREGLPSPHAKFTNPKFWGPATQQGVILPGGHKMKWHNLGPSNVQLRLPVATTSGTRAAFLCEAYVKDNATTERRKLARFKSHMHQIAQGRVIYRGTL
jgi:hypothetical protein